MTLRRRLISRLPLLATLLFVGGCDLKGCRQDNSSGLPSASNLPAPTYGEATVAGRITFDGDVPPPRPVGESEFCGTVMSETVVSEDGGLGNVLVYLDGVAPSTGADRPAVELDQEDCRFTPHVLGVQVGQPLEILNGDPMRHNVHYKPARNVHQNFAFETGGQRATTSFAVPEASPVTVKCDVHPWMTAYLGVFAHPFYAVTDAAGNYQIERVPAGEYNLVAWHEVYGKRSEPIVIADAGTESVDFLYARP